SDGNTSESIVAMMAVMFTGMIPASAMASIIAEEKEKNTLRVLMMSNVKPMEYLAGLAGYVFLLCMVNYIVFALMGGFNGIRLIYFMAVLITGSITSMLLGSILGIFTRNQMSLMGIMTPIILILAYLPVFATVNKSLQIVSWILYTQQMNNLIYDLSASNFTWDKFAIIGANIVILLALFISVYKAKSLE
ncbi:MAG: ABC transporter permease, partial [Treponema sp.]|nr:ABC transporter permease [Treponema sp.]